MNKQLALDYFKKAEDCKVKGCIEDAVSYYEKSLEYDDSFISAYYNLAISYYKLGLFSDAINTFEKLIELNHADASVYNNIGTLCFKNNNLVDAIKYFELALSIEPNYEEAKKNLGNIQKRLGETSTIFPEKRSVSIHEQKQNIGFVSVWYERGQAYVTKAIRDALSEQYNTFIFARNGGTLNNPLIETTGEWHVPNLVTYSKYKIPKEILVDWVKSHCITAVFFNEEYNFELIEEIRKLGVKTIGYYIWEWFNPDYVKRCNLVYDKIICPTKACYEKFKSLGLDNIEYVSWGIDLNQFKPGETNGNTKVRFFHPAGWGGLHARRGTQFVIDAFAKLNNSKSELLVHTQFHQDAATIDNYYQHLLNERNIKIQYGTVPREEIIRMYQEADVAILPSKWEGLGLTFLESIACGLPIITVDAPPMNEFVIHGETGFLCRVAERQKYDGIFVDGVHVDLNDMAEKMRIISEDNALRKKMRGRILSTRVSNWDFKSFQQKLLKVLMELIPESNRKGVNVAAGTGAMRSIYTLRMIDSSKTFGVGQEIISDRNDILQQFANCALDIHRVQNIIESRLDHIKEFTGISDAPLEKLVENAGKIVEEEWHRHIQSKRPIDEYYRNAPNEVIFSYANMDGSGSFWRLEYILRLLSVFISKDAAFLDFGAGIGETGIYFSGRCKVTTYDLASRTQDFAKYHAEKLGAKINFMSNLEDIRENTFNIISAQDVLEHIENPMRIVERLCSALKPGGYFVTSGFWFNPNVTGHLASNIQYRDTWLDDFKNMGLKYTCTFRGSNWAIAVFQKPNPGIGKREIFSISSDWMPKGRLKLISKKYSGCQLIREDDGRQFVVKDNYKEPLVVHLVGARWSNHPWGMENEIYRELEKFGATIIDTDFRGDFQHLPELLRQEAHVLFVIKGNGIPPELIMNSPCKTILWYQDDVFATDHASKQISYNGWAFDTVYSFDKMALDKYRELGVKTPRWLPLAMNPEVHRKMYLMKKVHEVSFVGNMYPNRKALLERLAKRFNLFVKSAFMDEMVEIFNKSKIVLNLGIGPTGIQSRVFEAMGCGSFLITNEIPHESRLFEDRKHLVYFNDKNIEELIAYYLKNEEERETIALAGYREVQAKHTYEQRIKKIFCDIFQTEDDCRRSDTKRKHMYSTHGVENVTTPALSIVIATCNRKLFLQKCIDSLLKNSEQRIEIVVVTDECVDDTRKWLDEISTKYTNIVHIPNKTHEGLHKSINRGITFTQGQYIGLLNDDIEVTKGWDSALISLLESNPEYGAAVPLVLDENGFISSMGLIEGIVSAKHPSIKPVHGIRGWVGRGKKRDQAPESTQVREVEYGCYLIVKKEVLEKVNGIAEDLGKYCVDADFGLKIRHAGYKNMYCPTSIVIDHGLDFESKKTTENNLRKSQELFFRKWLAFYVDENYGVKINKKFRIFIASTVDKTTLFQQVKNHVNSLLKQHHIINSVVCNEIAMKMDIDVMNHMFLESVISFQPDILILFGGNDIYAHTLRDLKRKLNIKIISWWHPEINHDPLIIPDWAIQLNKETDVCIFPNATVDYVKNAERKGVKCGCFLDKNELLADKLPLILNGAIGDRLLIYQNEVKEFYFSSTERKLLENSKFLIDKGIGIVAEHPLISVIRSNLLYLEAYIILSDYYINNKMYLKAKKILHAALNAGLKSPEIDKRLGMVFYQLGELEKAKPMIRSVIKNGCKDIKPYNVLGQIYIREENLKETEKILKKSLEVHKNNPVSLLNLGKIYREQNKIDESIFCFLEAKNVDYDLKYKDDIRENLEHLYSRKVLDIKDSGIKVTIFVLSFNRAKYMERALYLFSKQTFPRKAFEIIIVDSSTDNTKEVIGDAVKRYGFNIRYFFVPPEGPDPNTSLTNFGFKQAKGDIVLWSHPEILFTERMIEEFYKPHVYEDKLWVSGRMGVVLTREEQGKIDQVWNNDLDYIFANYNIRREVYRLGYKYWLPLLLSFKKDTYLKIGGVTEDLPVPRHTDLDLFFRMLAIGFSIHNPPGFQGIHQWHPPMEERGKELLPVMEKNRQIVYGWRRAFLQGELEAEQYAMRNEGHEIGIVPNIKEETIN
ncbi:MAG: glycosyltransferase [Candidatus Kuenenia sp.]|nr:glycosyltransferase [Candidatus Kuenenia hertensis]